MTVLRSYVGGAWTEPADGGRPVLAAVTGEEVARVSSAGIDLAAALDYGRIAGGPALRELTFHQRAALLKSLGQLLREHRQELYALFDHLEGELDESGFLRLAHKRPRMVRNLRNIFSRAGWQRAGRPSGRAASTVRLTPSTKAADSAAASPASGR